MQGESNASHCMWGAPTSSQAHRVWSAACHTTIVCEHIGLVARSRACVCKHRYHAITSRFECGMSHHKLVRAHHPSRKFTYVRMQASLPRKRLCKHRYHARGASNCNHSHPTSFVAQVSLVSSPPTWAPRFLFALQCHHGRKRRRVLKLHQQRQEQDATPRGISSSKPSAQATSRSETHILPRDLIVVDHEMFSTQWFQPCPKLIISD